MKKASPAPTLALVEDDHDLRDELAFQLRHFGFEVATFDSAAGLYRQLAVQQFDAVLLDIGLDGEDGLSICRHLRAHDAAMALVFVTARALRGDRITGLQAGADAYFTKPVDLEELVLLLRRLVTKGTASPLPLPSPSTSLGAQATGAAPPQPADRRKQDAAQPLEPWELQLARAQLQSPDGCRVPLSLQELQLLGALCSKPGQHCTHGELGRVLGALPDEWSRHRLEVIISRLRQKVERESSLELPLRTVRLLGYQWVGDVVVRLP